MPPAGVAYMLAVAPTTVRSWKRRGLIGLVCDVRTGVVGYDFGAVLEAAQQLKQTRPRGARHADGSSAPPGVSERCNNANRAGIAVPDAK